jgi:hypothetical protein
LKLKLLRRKASQRANPPGIGGEKLAQQLGGVVRNPHHSVVCSKISFRTAASDCCHKFLSVACAATFFFTLWPRCDISAEGRADFCIYTNEKISRKNG